MVILYSSMLDFREDEEGDFGRIRRQQQVIKAISQQLKDVTSIFKLPKAVGKLLGSIQTNLPEECASGLWYGFPQRQ